MENQTEIIRAEIPEVAAITRDECWLEGERRGHPVDPADVRVQQRVAELILNGVGLQLRNHCVSSGGSQTRSDGEINLDFAAG